MNENTNFFSSMFCQSGLDKKLNLFLGLLTKLSSLPTIIFFIFSLIKSQVNFSEKNLKIFVLILEYISIMKIYYTLSSFKVENFRKSV